MSTDAVSVSSSSSNTPATGSAAAPAAASIPTALKAIKTAAADGPAYQAPAPEAVADSDWNAAPPADNRLALALRPVVAHPPVSVGRPQASLSPAAQACQALAHAAVNRTPSLATEQDRFWEYTFVSQTPSTGANGTKTKGPNWWQPS